MADSTLTQTTFAYSIASEVTYNGAPVLFSDYATFETLARILPLPNAQKQADEPRIGGGAASAYPTFQRSRVLEPMAIDISDIVNTDMLCAKLARRHMGGVDGDVAIATVEATKLFKHTFLKRNMDTGAGGRQLPGTSIIMKNNGAYFVYAGCVGGSLQIQQNGVDDPRYTSGLIGTGLYLDAATYVSAGTFTAPTRDPLRDMLGPETAITYNDGSARSLQGRWKSFSWSSNNNIDTNDLRAGMSRVAAAACPTRGWYRSFLNASDETVSLEFRVAHDGAMLEWNSAQLDTAITSFLIEMKGSCHPTTAANNQFKVGIAVGKSYFRNIRGGDDNNLAVVDVQVFPVRNGSYFGVHQLQFTTHDISVIN